MFHAKHSLHAKCFVCSGLIFGFVSELLNGKIANKSVDKRFHYAGRLGIEAKARFPQTHKAMVQRELAATAH